MVSYFNGVLLSDGHHSLKPLASAGLKLAHDSCHVRRKYKAAEKTFTAESAFILDKIQLLFAIEEQIKGQPPDKILKAR